MAAKEFCTILYTYALKRVEYLYSWHSLIFNYWKADTILYFWAERNLNSFQKTKHGIPTLNVLPGQHGCILNTSTCCSSGYTMLTTVPTSSRSASRTVRTVKVGHCCRESKPTPVLSHKCRTTKLWQLDNHQPSQSSIYVLNASANVSQGNWLL